MVRIECDVRGDGERFELLGATRLRLIMTTTPRTNSDGPIM